MRSVAVVLGAMALGCGSSSPVGSVPSTEVTADAAAPGAIDASDAAVAAPPSSEDGGAAGAFDATGPAVWADGGYVSPTYTRAGDLSFTGAQGAQSVECDGVDTLVLSGCGCDVHAGRILSTTASSSLDGGLPSRWTCTGVPDDPVKGATVIAWIECRRVYF